MVLGPGELELQGPAWWRLLRLPRRRLRLLRRRLRLLLRERLLLRAR